MLTEANNEIIPAEQIIWERFEAGDFSAFSVLYQKYARPLLHYGMRICKQEEIVKDAVHDLFIELWHSKTNTASIKNKEFYLLKSLRFKILRVDKRVAVFDKITKLLTVQHEHILSPEDEMALKESNDETVLTVQKALHQLPPRQREVIYLKYYKGFSNAEIADMLNINYQSVSNLLQRAIQALKLAIPLYHFISLYLFFCSPNIFL